MNELLTKSTGRAEFKDSELGRIPRSWEIFTLNDISTFSQGVQIDVEKHFDSISADRVRFLRISDYTKPEEPPRYIEKKYASKGLVGREDVIMIRYGETGRVCRGLEGAIANNLFTIKPCDAISKDFLYQSLVSQRIKKLLGDLAASSAMPAINFSALKSVKLGVPPISEQKKIASILTSVDEVIENTQKQINKLQDLKKATMNELLTKGIGHTKFKDSELGRIPKSWEIYKLGNLCDFTQGIQITLEETLRANQAGYIRYLYINDFSSDKNLRFVEDKYPSKIVSDDDLVMANTGHSAGTAFCGKKGVLSNNAFKISIRKNIMTEYLYHFLSTEDYWLNIGKLFNTAGQPHVGHGNIAKLRFLCPTLDEQEKIVSVIGKIDEYIKFKNRKLRQTQSLKKSLMQDLLTGKVRVKVN